MIPILLGDARDVLGFSLAGIETISCRTPDDAVRALEHDAIFLVSASVAPWIADRLTDRMHVILPPR